MNRLHLVAVFALFLSGCSFSGPTDRLAQAERAGMVREGMTMDEVSSVVGRKPNTWDLYEQSGQDTLWTPNGKLRSEGGHYCFHLRDGKVVNVRRVFDTEYQRARFEAGLQ